FIAWTRPDRIPEGEGQQNIRAREAFYKALVKAEGKEVADSLLLRKLSKTAEGFKTDTRALMASDIGTIMGSADHARARSIHDTVRDVSTFRRQKGMEDAAIGLAHQKAIFRDPKLREEVGAEFTNIINGHEDYGRRRFSREELSTFARKAAENCCARREV